MAVVVAVVVVVADDWMMHKLGRYVICVEQDANNTDDGSFYSLAVCAPSLSSGSASDE